MKKLFLLSLVTSLSVLGSPFVVHADIAHNFPLDLGYEWFTPDRDDNYYIESRCATIRTASAGYEQLDGILQEFNNSNLQSCRDFIADYQDEAMEFMQGQGWSGKFDWMIDIDACRADDKILSFTENVTSYLGGAHGSYTVIGHNYETASGRELSLRDVSADYNDLYQAVMNQLDQKYNSVGALFEGYEGNVKNAFDNDAVSWLLEVDRVVIFFNQYEIAPYAAGILTVDLPFREYPGLLKDEYAYQGEGMMRQLDLYMYEPVIEDFNKDQIQDQLLVHCSQDYESFECELTIDYNGASVTEKAWGSMEEICLVTSADNRIYLYAQNISENDYETLYVFDLNGSAPVLAGTVGNLGMENQANSYPECMYLYSRVNLLGTYSGYRAYQVGADGMPVALGDDYKIWRGNDENSFHLVSALDLKLWSCDENGIETEEVYYPAGTSFLPYSSDGAGYMEVILDDGSHCRFHVEKSEEGWGYSINGVHEGDCFELVPYAG